MIAKSIGTGRGACGLADYLVHDQGTREDPRPTTSKRVDAVGLINLPPGSIAEGIAVMRGTARDQAVLKRLAGVSARGRPTLDPYHHLTLAWKPGYRPTYDESDAAVSSALRKVGYGEHHQAIWVAHNDKGHHHVHAMANRIDPDTGRTLKLSHERRKLSAWAVEYERAHRAPGKDLDCPAREWRAETSALYQQRDRERAKKGLSRVVSLVFVSERRIDRKIKKKQLNRPKIERTRGPERPQHTDEERAEWRALYERRRKEGKPRQEQRAERRELAARQHVRRSNAGSEVGAGHSAEGTVRRRRAPVEEPAAAPAIAKEMATAAPLAQQVEEESEERPARRRKRKPHRQQGARTAPGFLARTAAAVGVAARRAAQTGASVARGAAAAAATATTAPAKAIRTRLGGDEERQRRRLRKKLDRAAATHQVRHWAGGREIVDALLYRPPKSAEWGKPGSVERMQYVLELIRADNRRLPSLTSAGRKHAAEARRVIDAVALEQWNLCHPSGAESIYPEAESRHEARSDPPAPAPTAPPKQLGYAEALDALTRKRARDETPTAEPEQHELRAGGRPDVKLPAQRPSELSPGPQPTDDLTRRTR